MYLCLVIVFCVFFDGKNQELFGPMDPLRRSGPKRKTDHALSGSRRIEVIQSPMRSYHRSSLQRRGRWS